MVSKVLLIGSPLDGVYLVGPFNHIDDALEHARANTADYMDWWVADMKTPKEDKEE